MAGYRGACHCGRVTFEVNAALTALSQCNCSMCGKKGALSYGRKSRFAVLALTIQSAASGDTRSRYAQLGGLLLG